MPRNMNIKSCTYFLLLTFMSTLKMAAPSFPMALYDSIHTPSLTNAIFFSPMSVKATVAVAGLAAKGKTQKEILQSIESTEESLPNDVLLPGKIKDLLQSRQIYIGKNLFDSQFLEKLSPAYEVQNIRFGPREVEKQLNDQVKGATKKKIPHIFPSSLNRNTALAVVNSMYMHSPWKYEFTSTMKRGFLKPMVHQYGDFMFANLTDLNAAVLQLEFKNNDAKLLVLQPNDNDLHRLSEQLLSEDLTRLSERLKSTYMSLYFPIIKEIKMSLSLKDAITALGIDRAFTASANFGEIIDACEEDAALYMQTLRQHSSFRSGRESAHFVAVTGMQMDLNNATRGICSCVPDTYETEFADPKDIVENIDMSVRKKDAPHYYFEHKLFFALINNNEILFIGTLPREK